MNTSLSSADISEIERLTVEKEQKMQQARQHMETSNNIKIIRESQYKMKLFNSIN